MPAPVSTKTRSEALTRSGGNSLPGPTLGSGTMTPKGELRDDASPDRYPRYYARNFHYQSEGYLGQTSAALYDLQVELLFGGTADAMRRRILPPVVRFARARNASAAHPLRILDVACGTGH